MQMKTKLLMSLLFVVLLILSGCKLEGNVSEEGAGIQGVRVRMLLPITEGALQPVRIYSTLTDSNGNYTLESRDNILTNEEIAKYSRAFLTFTKRNYIFNPAEIGISSAINNPDIEGVNLSTPDCYPGDAVISTSESLAELKGFKTIGGSLIVQGATVETLDELSQITQICGDLIIDSNVNLTSVQALSSVVKVWGKVDITNNPRLVNIGCFENLESSGKDITIRNNSALKSLAGLSVNSNLNVKIMIDSNEGLTTLEGIDIPSTFSKTLTISGSPLLINLSGLNFPDVSNARLDIDRNAGLISLTGLENIKTISSLSLGELPLITSLDPIKGINTASTVRIVKCSGLSNLTGLENLTAKSLYISSNDNLSSLEGLKVSHSTGYIRISENMNLLSMSGLNVPTGFTGEIEIRSNPSLQTLTGMTLSPVFLGRLEVLKNSSLEDINLSGVTTIEHEIFISNNEGLISLTGLGDITSANSIRLLSNHALTSLQGLHNLASINSLNISSCNALISLDGLDSLISLNSLRIEGNDSLETFNGLDALTTLSENLRITQNASLINLNALSDSLGSLSELNISNNETLKTLTGINSLSNVGHLTLSGMPELTSIDALSNLKRVRTRLLINDLDSITSLAPLKQLYGLIDYSVQISNNDALENLEGLENIREVNLLYILNNNNLKTLEHLSSLRTILEEIKVAENDSLVDPGLGNLKNMPGYFIFTDNPELCTSLINKLKNQLTYYSRILMKPEISGNKFCW